MEEKKTDGGLDRPSGENRGMRRENGENEALTSVLLSEEKKKEKVEGPDEVWCLGSQNNK